MNNYTTNAFTAWHSFDIGANSRILTGAIG